MKLWLVALGTLACASAHATPIVSGLTEVRLDEPVALAVLDAGVTPSATGTGTFDLNTLTFGFPITGGALDIMSGVDLFTLSADSDVDGSRSCWHSRAPQPAR
jgi:hypothetical protein